MRRGRTTPGRDADLRRIQEFLAEGELIAARRRILRVLKRQENVRTPPPEALIALASAMESGRIDYPGRAEEVSRFNKTIEAHNYERAMSRGRAILEQQNNLKNGPTEQLSALLQAVEDERVNYAARDEDIRRMSHAMQQGKFRVAEARARQILNQQRQLQPSTTR